MAKTNRRQIDRVERAQRLEVKSKRNSDGLYDYQRRAVDLIAASEDDDYSSLSEDDSNYGKY